jgi:hypothetical protein
VSDEEALEIAEAIMIEQEVSQTPGFGLLTIPRLRAMLMTAAQRGAEKERPF